MDDQFKLGVEALWDLDCVPAAEVSERGLLLRITAPEVKDDKNKGKPLNLALVIDASGSMEGARLHAARQATIGIIEQLGDQDRVSVISFAQDVCLHVKGSLVTPDNREKMIEDIESIRSRGMTDLGSGWMAGASAVADILDDECKNGYVVVLSDGMANRGVIDPVELAHHATELLARGITTSCVGIGDDYAPLQLDAIAEAGGGRLHDCANSDEIIEVLLGEFGAVRETVASSVELELVYATGTETELLTRLPSTHEENRIRLRLGALGSAGHRESAFLVKVPACLAGGVFRFEYRVDWVNPETGERCTLPWASTLLTVIDPLQYQERIHNRDVTVARKIALLWNSSLIYESVRSNEAGEYQQAGDLIRSNLQSLSQFVDGLEDSDELMRKMTAHYETVRKPWHDKRAKRDSFVYSKKSMKNEEDFRSRIFGRVQALEKSRRARRNDNQEGPMK